MRTIVHEVDFDVGLQRLFAGDAERADEWLRQTVEDVLESCCKIQGKDHDAYYVTQQNTRES